MNPQNSDGIRRASKLWLYLLHTLSTMKADRPFEVGTADKIGADARIYRDTLKPLMTFVAQNEFVIDAKGRRQEVLRFGENADGSTQLIHACGPVWSVVFAIRGAEFRPAAETVAAVIRKAFPNLTETTAPPAEVRNIVAAPSEYVERAQASVLALPVPSVPRLSPSKSESIGNRGDWLQEFAETVATGDEALDAILLRPLLAQTSESERRIAMSGIRHGRAVAAEERRLRAEQRQIGKGERKERAETFRDIMARVQRMRLHAGENGATA